LEQSGHWNREGCDEEQGALDSFLFSFTGSRIDLLCDDTTVAIISRFEGGDESEDFLEDDSLDEQVKLFSQSDPVDDGGGEDSISLLTP